MERGGKDGKGDKAAGLRAKRRQKFLLELEGCDEEADREAWAMFEEMQLKKAAPTPAAAAPIGDPAPAPGFMAQGAPAPLIAPDAAGPAAPAAAAAPGAPPAPAA